MRPDLRVLYIAGYSERTPDSMTLPASSTVLQKPFSGDSLGREIRKLVHRSGAKGA
jgi:two-component SAPR family response regulator